jgi:hypothetical protein
MRPKHNRFTPLLGLFEKTLERQLKGRLLEIKFLGLGTI